MIEGSLEHIVFGQVIDGCRDSGEIEVKWTVEGKEFVLVTDTWHLDTCISIELHLTENT